MCYGFVKVFESQLLTETFRGSAQARPKQALHDIYIWYVGPSFNSYAPPNAGHSGFRMYAVLIQQLVNLHSIVAMNAGTLNVV